jgi:hypothetical protein
MAQARALQLEFCCSPLDGEEGIEADLNDVSFPICSCDEACDCGDEDNDSDEDSCTGASTEF